jgi:copper oxidase (laccase) domain-containing protein
MNKPFNEPMNQGRFETWTTKPDLPFLHAHQVHGTDIASPETLPCEADGIFVSWEKLNHPLAIKTADCLPIAIEGEQGVIFLHAGWRGLANGILAKPEIEMIKPNNVMIGPSIKECCFEVSADFKSNFPESPFFKEIEGKLFFNLQEEAKRLIIKRFPQVLVQMSLNCTCCDERFHSYRRNKTTERNWNLYIKG